MIRIVLALSIVVLDCLLCVAQTRDVQRIKIVSTWGGLGEPQRNELLIVHTNRGYQARDKRIERRLVGELLRAIDEPEVKKLELANIGITQEWLAANAETAAGEYANSHISRAAPNQRALFLSSFKNVQLAERLLPSILKGNWTDDYPTLRIEITDSDSRQTVISSDEQAPFMLPFEIDGNGHGTRTYNANISRAVSALLPEKFTNKPRLSGVALRGELAAAVMRHIEDDWNLLDVENKAGPALGELKKTYQLRSADLNAY